MIRGMTAFVIKRKLFSWGEIGINIRSTNYKYLDIYISRIPLGAEALEREIFQEVAEKIRRGKIEIALTANLLGSQELSEKELFQIKRSFLLALKELIEFKKAQGKKIEEEIKLLGASLRRRTKAFKGYLKRKKKTNHLQEDILEEVSLISFYLSHLDKILAKKRERAGKILDFLSQELLREINTILAKLKDRRLSLEAVYFKEEVDRIRELAQNIE